METTKINLLQESLRNLKLQPVEEGDKDGVYSNRFLLGKLLATKSFRQFTVAEIIQKTWKTRSKVHINKFEDNIFKFTFGTREEKERIFREKPWSFNGADVILKECPKELSLKEVSFANSTITIQVHGLPLVFIHAERAEKIGKMIGSLQRELISKKCVVANRYLKF